jgi:hypothetical protein
MSRITFVVAAGIGVGLLASGTAAAWPGKSDKDTETDPAAAQQRAAEQERAQREQIAKTMREWQAKLSDSRWELEVVVSKGGPAQVVEADVLTFKSGSVNSDVLAKAGHKPASFSLYPPTEESVAWEAMQSKEEQGVTETVIWRGEVTGETMQGTLVKKRAKGDKETVDTLSFSGRRMADAPAPTPAAAQPESPSAAPAPDAPAQDPAT